jgi:hypothetical protein
MVSGQNLHETTQQTNASDKAHDFAHASATIHIAPAAVGLFELGDVTSQTAEVAQPQHKKTRKGDENDAKLKQTFAITAGEI